MWGRRRGSRLRYDEVWVQDAFMSVNVSVQCVSVLRVTVLLY